MVGSEKQTARRSLGRVRGREAGSSQGERDGGREKPRNGTRGYMYTLMGRKRK